MCNQGVTWLVSVELHLGDSRCHLPGDRKLIRFFADGADRGDRWELYDLGEDIGETNDLAARFPDEVPVGPAELIVLVDEAPKNGAKGEKSLLGLFADEPEVVDEAMEHVRERRKNWRTRPVI